MTFDVESEAEKVDKDAEKERLLIKTPIGVVRQRTRSETREEIARAVGRTETLVGIDAINRGREGIFLVFPFEE